MTLTQVYIKEGLAMIDAFKFQIPWHCISWVDLSLLVVTNQRNLQKSVVTSLLRGSRLTRTAPHNLFSTTLSPTAAEGSQRLQNDKPGLVVEPRAQERFGFIN
jgi:hypothetical protein